MLATEVLGHAGYRAQHLSARRRARWLALALAVSAMLWGPAAIAQPLGPLYAEALAHDASLRAAEADAQAAHWRAEQARSRLLPQVGLQAGAQRTRSKATLLGFRNDNTVNTYSATLAASQALYRRADRIAWEAGQTAADAARIQLRSRRDQLLLELAQAYFDVLAARDDLAVISKQEQAASRQLELAQARFDLGDATVVGVREARARMDLAQAQKIALENELQTRSAALEQLVGRQGLAPIPLARPIHLPPLQPAQPEPWIADALEHHPALQQQRMAVELAQLEIDRARAGHYPTVDLEASVAEVRRSGGGNNLATALSGGRRGTNASIGVTLNLPLFAGHAVQNQVREAVALHEKARAELEQSERELTQATRATFLTVQSGHSRVRALESARHSSQDAVDANEIGYEIGVNIAIDVLNAQGQLFQTERDLARARYDLLLGWLQLRQVAGVLDAADLQQIDALLKRPDPAAAH